MDFKKITPKFGEYFKRTLFSFMGVFNIIKSIVKVLVIALVAILVIRSDMDKRFLLFIFPLLKREQ
jgi:flagellar biosynthetic protein FlhB